MVNIVSWIKTKSVICPLRFITSGLPDVYQISTYLNIAQGRKSNGFYL